MSQWHVRESGEPGAPAVVFLHGAGLGGGMWRESLAGARLTRATWSEVRSECPTLLVAGERETAVRQSNAALAAVMPRAIARYVPELGHGWLGRRMELHVDMVEAWLTKEESAAGLAAEGPSPAAVSALLRGLRDAD